MKAKKRMQEIDFFAGKRVINSCVDAVDCLACGI